MYSLKSLDDLFFGPLDSKYCIIFYIFMVIFFISLLMMLVNGIHSVLLGKQKLSANKVLSLVLAIAYMALLYLHQRLLYSMCIKSNL